MRSEVYSGHMRKTGKKKTRYTDAEIARIKEDAYNEGLSATGAAPHAPDTGAESTRWEGLTATGIGPKSTRWNDGYAIGHQDGKREQLADLEEWLTTADGRPGKRQVLDRIAQLTQELDTHA